MKNYLLPLMTGLFLVLQLQAAECTWIGPNNGNWSQASNWSCGIVPGAADDVIVSGSTVQLDMTTAIGSLTVSGIANINGTATLTVNDDMSLGQSGEYHFFPEINVFGQSDLAQCDIYIMNHPMRLYGGGNCDGGFLWMENGGIFIIPTGANLEVNGNWNIYGFVEYQSFIINGTLHKTGDGYMNFEALYLFDNGVVNIDQGTIANYLSNTQNCIINHSEINIGETAGFYIARQLDIDSTVFEGGNIFQMMSIVNFGNNNIINSHYQLLSGNTASTASVLIKSLRQTGGSCNAYITVQENYEFVAGQVSNINVLGLFIISDTTATEGMRLMINNTASGGGTFNSNDHFVGSNFTIAAGTTFTYSGDNADFGLHVYLYGNLHNNSNYLFIDNLESFEGAAISGSGTLGPTFFTPTKADISPGSPVGSLVVAPEFSPGKWVFQDNTVHMDIHFQNNAVSQDTLIVDDKLQLNSDLEVTESGNVPNGTYTIITATDSILGTFSNVSLPPGYTLVYTTNAVLLVKEIIAANSNLAESPAVKVYPNPNDGRFTLSFEGVRNNYIKINLLNQLGQVMYSAELSAGTTEWTSGTTIGKLPAGLYFLEVRGEKQQQMLKIEVY